MNLVSFLVIFKKVKIRKKTQILTKTSLQFRLLIMNNFNQTGLKLQNNCLKQSKLDKINLNDDQSEKWQNYLVNIQKAYNKKESEEHQKNIFNQFLRDCFGYDVNTQNRQDSVIYDKFGVAQVIIEFKALFNKAEMPGLENLNCKALQELIWYYLEETTENKSVKHLIITNGNNFLIWDGADFQEIVGSDKKLQKDFGDFQNKNSIDKKLKLSY